MGKHYGCELDTATVADVRQIIANLYGVRLPSDIELLLLYRMVNLQHFDKLSEAERDLLLTVRPEMLAWWHDAQEELGI